ncbi:MAG: type II/IV secretion system protein [Parcubacteria group bacterium]|nr:type II/IV secretion system protein [Parcubacteria group bacterium]
MPTPYPVLSRLREKKLLTEAQYTDLVRKIASEMKNEDDVLFDSGFVAETDAVKIKSEIYGIPFFDVSRVDVQQDVLALIPEEVAKTYAIIPLKKENGTLSVGVLDPKNFKAVEAAAFIAKDHDLKVEYFLIAKTAFLSLIKKYKILGKEVEAVLGRAKEKFEAKTEEKKEESMEEVIKSAPVSKIVSVIIKHAVDAGASDIHIEPRVEGSQVRYRIDGILRVKTVLPMYVHSAIVSRIKVLANLKLDETRKPQDGRIKIDFEGAQADLRVSTLPLLGQEKVVMRILDTSGVVLTLEQLGFRDVFVEKINKSIHQAYGLILVCGPTGAGKSTTLYSVLNLLNEEGVNIVTLEDPAEYYIKGINQSQVNAEVGFNFASGLRAILRQDPDIIMVGEIRDNETAELAVHSALTGHIVFSTLHTNNAIGAFPRLMDMHVEPFLLSSTLKGVVAQRLVRKICANCKSEISLHDETIRLIREEVASVPKEYLKYVSFEEMKFFKGKGCVRCNGSGYKGRTVIAEVILVTEKMQSIIARGFQQKEVDEELISQKAISMRQDGLLKVLTGVTTYEEVLRVMQV